MTDLEQLLKRIEELERRVLILETNPTTCIHDHAEGDSYEP